MVRDECRHFDNALQRRGCFSFHLRAIFVKMPFENSMILPAALSGSVFTFEALVSLRVANGALVALSHMYRGWWGSFSARCRR